MTTYLGKSCSFGLPRVPFVNCRQFMYLVIFLLVLRAGCGIWLYQFLIIAYLFTLHIFFFHGLKMCMWFGFNPAVYFCHFSLLLTLSFFAGATSTSLKFDLYCWFCHEVAHFIIAADPDDDEKPLESLELQPQSTDPTHSHPSATPFSDLIHEASGGLSELEMSLPRVLPATNNELELGHMTDNSANENEVELGHMTGNSDDVRTENTIDMEQHEPDRGMVLPYIKLLFKCWNKLGSNFRVETSVVILAAYNGQFKNYSSDEDGIRVHPLAQNSSTRWVFEVSLLF